MKNAILILIALGTGAKKDNDIRNILNQEFSVADLGQKDDEEIKKSIDEALFS